jgi:hypothetical protein
VPSDAFVVVWGSYLRNSHTSEGVGVEVLLLLLTLDAVDSTDVSGCDERYLVDPASSHMLVSKIKPCMPKYTLW